MRVREIMSPNPAFVGPGVSLVEVARLMKANNCGEIPVVDNDRVIGVVTDRDITCRVVAEGRIPGDVKAVDIMTRPVVTAMPDDTIDTAIRLMEKQQILRLPVVDRNGNIVGVLSQSDVVRNVPLAQAGELSRTLALRSRRRNANVL